MKRNLAIILLTSIMLCCLSLFAACNTGTHTHTIEKVEAVAATCETAGNTEYYRCTDCEKTFSDELATTEIAPESVVVTALGHDEESHDAKAATCTEDGWDAYVTCKREGCDYTTKVVIPAAHTEVIDQAKAATCTEKGLTEGKHCSVCEEVIVAQQDVPALNHDYGSEITTQPTCTEKGVRTYTCKREGCGHSYTEDVAIDPNAHDIENHVAKAATCTEDGYEAYETCKRTGCEYTTYQKIDAIGHKNKVHHAKVEAKCTETGTIEYWSCPDCGKNYSDVDCTKVVTDLTIKALDHDIENHVAKAATCTEDGWDAYDTCKREGCKYTTYKKIDALGHDYAESTVAATETEDGYKYYVCGRCNDDYKVYIYNGINDKVAVSTGMIKQVASNRVDNKGTLTYRVQTASAHRVKLYVNVSSTGTQSFSQVLDLTTVISSVKLNGAAVSGYSGLVPTGEDIYADYLIGEIDLVAGKNLIEITVGESSWAGPFFRSISIETTESVTLVEPFDGYVVKATANEVFVVGAYKDTAGDRILPNGNNADMRVTVGVKATKTGAVDLYATVSGHGFDAVSLNQVISALSVNGDSVTVPATALPKATDVYSQYKVATVTLNEGENVISLTFTHLAYFGPFFRELMVASLDKVEFYNAVPTFSGADSKVAVTEGMTQSTDNKVLGEGTMTYKINASKAGTAKLYVTISSMGAVLGGAADVNTVITPITVNGNAVTDYSGTIPEGADRYTGLYIGEIDLQEGVNVITLTIAKYAWTGPYFRSISLIGDATFSLLDANA